MHRNNDRKIAEWLGMLNQPHCPTCGTPWREMGDVNYHIVTLCKGQFVWDKIPHYSTSDADAIALLPRLVEKGFGVEISSSEGGWIVEIGNGASIDFAREQPTIALAISVATLQLIESI